MLLVACLLWLLVLHDRHHLHLHLLELLEHRHLVLGCHRGIILHLSHLLLHLLHLHRKHLLLLALLWVGLRILLWSSWLLLGRSLEVHFVERIRRLSLNLWVHHLYCWVEGTCSCCCLVAILHWCAET
jgi:hypothetical protein